MRNVVPALVVGFSMLSSFIYGQDVVGGVTARAMDINAYPYGTISSFNLSEKITKGSKYLYETWQIGDIELKDGIIENCPLNIDLQNNVVEINTDKGIRVLSMSKIEKLKVGFNNVNVQHYDNANTFNGNQAQLAGLVEVLVDDDVKLVKYPFLYKKEGSYNAALDMGNDETKLVIRNRYLLYTQNKLVEIPTSKRKFLALFSSSQQETLESFLKDKNISLKDQSDLISTFNFINDNQLGVSMNGI